MVYHRPLFLLLPEFKFQPKSAWDLPFDRAEITHPMEALLQAIYTKDSVILEKQNAILEKTDIIQKKSQVIDEQQKRIEMVPRYQTVV